MLSLRRAMQSFFQDPLCLLNPRMTAASRCPIRSPCSGLAAANEAARTARVRNSVPPRRLLRRTMQCANHHPTNSPGGQRRASASPGPRRRARLIVCYEPVSARDVGCLDPGGRSSTCCRICSAFSCLIYNLIFIAHDLVGGES